jgi:hypothetical protein
MMGRLSHEQEQFFYSFRLDEAVSDDHPVRAIAAVLDLSWVHSELAPYYSRLVSALRIERLLAKVEAEHNARIRLCRYVVYEDEYDEAIAKGLPLPSCFALLPRDLSREEWIEKYSPKQDGETTDR